MNTGFLWGSAFFHQTAEISVPELENFPVTATTVDISWMFLPLSSRFLTL